MTEEQKRDALKWVDTKPFINQGFAPYAIQTIRQALSEHRKNTEKKDFSDRKPYGRPYKTTYGCNKSCTKRGMYLHVWSMIKRFRYWLASLIVGGEIKCLDTEKKNWEQEQLDLGNTITKVYIAHTVH